MNPKKFPIFQKSLSHLKYFSQLSHIISLKRFSTSMQNIKIVFFHRPLTIPKIHTVYLCEHAVNTCKTRFTPIDSLAKKPEKKGSYCTQIGVKSKQSRQCVAYSQAQRPYTPHSFYASAVNCPLKNTSAS